MAAETATFAEFARILGVKPSAVTALRHDNRLVLTADGKRVQVAETQQRLRDTADPSKVGVVARHAAARGAGEGQGGSMPAVEPQEPADGEQGDAEADAAAIGAYQSSRAKREHFQALTAQMEYEQSIGKLMDAVEVSAAIATATTVLRSSLERLPDVLGPQLAAITDEGEARALLAEAIEHALDETARQFSNLAKQATV